MLFQDRYPLAFKLYPYRRSSDQDAERPVRHPVVVVGGGPIGLAMALDLGLQGLPVVLLDDHEGVGEGSRAICFAKRTLEIADRYGCGAELLDKGVVWNVGKIFHDDHKVFEFNLLPEEGHKYPAFINLQQPYFEKALYDRIVSANAGGANIDVRGKNRVENVNLHKDHARIHVVTPEGPYSLESEWLIGCDGAGSPLRKMVGADFEGRVFEDNFLIADIRMQADFPTERWFWFEPHFKSGDSALLHKQPDGIWRIDFQIGWDIDRETELEERNIRARLDAMLGDVEYEIVWSSIYTFQCRRMKSFRHGRLIFAGDAAHQVSPFGARGANSGIQDVDNLGWKLGLLLRGAADERILDSYTEEREAAADENIMNSTRSTDFITPKTKISKVFRNAVLDLATDHPFARTMVNSGRLSSPFSYNGFPLIGADALPGGPARSRPGSACPDAPIGEKFLLERLGSGFTLLVINGTVDGFEAPDGVPFEVLHVDSVSDPSCALTQRYLGSEKTAVYLIRPDQHIAGRWAEYDTHQVAETMKINLGKG